MRPPCQKKKVILAIETQPPAVWEPQHPMGNTSFLAAGAGEAEEPLTLHHVVCCSAAHSPSTPRKVSATAVTASLCHCPIGQHISGERLNIEEEQASLASSKMRLLAYLRACHLLPCRLWVGWVLPVQKKKNPLRFSIANH